MDQDGYPVDQDCDDDNAAIHSGAEELCDGLDNDCDELTDEGGEGTGESCPGKSCLDLLDSGVTTSGPTGSIPAEGTHSGPSAIRSATDA